MQGSFAVFIVQQDSGVEIGRYSNTEEALNVNEKRQPTYGCGLPANLHVIWIR